MAKEEAKRRRSAISEQYDALCKQTLAKKIFLAWIIKLCVREFEEIGAEEIAEHYIIGIPEVSETSVLPLIDTAGVEDTSVAEGKVTYDIRFLVKLPRNDGRIHLIINVEAQSNFYPGYPLIKRGIYYGSRMISSQKGVEFTGSHYENIKKVYSIWICTNPPKYRKNTMNSYHFRERHVIGCVKEKQENYDLMEVVMVCLGKMEDTEGNGLLRFLSIILAPKMDVKSKKKILEDEFQIHMTNEIEKEAEKMCNLSDGIWEEGRRDILKEKIQMKLRKGKSEGQIAEELEESVATIRRLCKEIPECV